MAAGDLTVFERRVFETLLDPSHPGMAALLAQVAACRVTDRELTGVGFFTTVTVPGDLAVTGLDTVQLTDIHAELDGEVFGTFVLWIDHGRIEMLEGVTFQGPWTDREAELTLVAAHPPGGTPTDLERIDAAMSQGH